MIRNRKMLIGKGSYGYIYRAFCVSRNKYVAIKEFRIDVVKKHPQSFLMEKEVLKMLKHPSIVSYIDSFEYSIVMEYMDTDLAQLLHQCPLQPRHIKLFLKQLLEGLCFIHERNILHLDIKCDNLLINRAGNLKIGDFGIACPPDHTQNNQGKMSTNVVSLWYRPLELLLGSRSYHGEVDIWSAGCVMAQMFTRLVLFRGEGRDEKEVYWKQVYLIYELCGTPLYNGHHLIQTEETCLFYNAQFLPRWQYFAPKRNQERPSILHITHSKYLSPAAISLLDNMCRLHPKKRISAREALKSDYFMTEWPRPECIQLDQYLRS